MLCDYFFFEQEFKQYIKIFNIKFKIGRNIKQIVEYINKYLGKPP